MKVLPRLDIFKVRQLKGSPRTTQDTMEETGWDPKLGRILSKSWDKKGIFCGDFCAAAAARRERWQWAKQTTDARARGDSQVSAANYRRRPGQLYTRSPAFKEGVETVLNTVLCISIKQLQDALP